MLTWRAQAAVLALRDALCIRYFAGDEFVEPSSATGDRCNQRRAALQFHRT
jgi:hypothetical protein